MMLSNPSSLLSAPTASTTNLISFCLLIPNEPRKVQQHLSYVSNSSSIMSHFTLRFKNNSCFYSPQQFQRTHFSFPSLLEKRDDIFCVYALKKLRKPDTSLMEMSDLDDEDEMDDEFNEEDQDIEDEGMFLPFGQMKKWQENKPRGFGKGKVYDTSIEDKLLEEIEQSRKAQAANINNLKNNPVKPAIKKDDQKKKAPEVVPSGIPVRVVNLPKKKNIHRDLQSAFKEVPGIVNIIPAVSGNKKTKDPICKGFAFVDFKSEVDADRFVRQFSGQNVTFGRIQKQIKCTMINSQASNSSDDESAGSYSVSNLTVPSLEEDINASFVTDDSSFEEDTDELLTVKLQDVSDNVESFSRSELDIGESVEPMIEPTNSSRSFRKQDKNWTAKKNNIAKVKEEKVPKLEIPGSAKRLRIKEKSVLTDVFTKYGSQSALVSGEES